jgi:hypothetical protein
MDGYRTSSTLSEGVCVEFVASSTEVGLFFYTWKWLKNKKQEKKSACLALWGIAYFPLGFFFVAYFYFLKWDMRPKQRVMNPKISIRIRKKKPVGTLYWYQHIYLKNQSPYHGR